MQALSVIIPAHNNGPVLGRTLRSAVDAVAFFHAADPTHQAVRTEIVVVDDGSTDDTRQVVEQAARHNPAIQFHHCPQAGGASHARNLGVARSHGEVLFFLDGDDVFYPAHLAVCWDALAARPELGFVKTHAFLADPVHPEWQPRIENTLVINLCVRRWCHDFIEGFPEVHLFRRRGDQWSHWMDAVGSKEDAFYNLVLSGLFPGQMLAEPTVQYVRYPGNAYDRQYAKFQKTPVEAAAQLGEEERWREQLVLLLVQQQLRYLRQKRGQPPKN